MTILQQRSNVALGSRFRTALKPREIFLHDGRRLRRFRIGTRLQLAAAGLTAALLGWTGFVTVHYVAGATGDVAQMQARVAQMEEDVTAIRTAADERAHQLEQRQIVLARMMADRADPQEVARLLPAQFQAPANPAALEVSEAYSNLDGMQIALVEQAQMVAQGRIARASSLARQVGLDPQRLGLEGVGGPFVPASAANDVDPRFLELFATWRRLEAAERGIASIPSIMPVQGIRFTSGFGGRSDPFQSRAAFHAGIDMAGPIGTPIHATADAIVGRAGTSNGYGNLIELDHGSGIATRYGHLSRIMVTAGDHVRRGQVIGLMGSTGRSTGSHLHYEVRIDGHAVNPLPFLQTGQALIAAQSPLAAGGQGGGR
jgi:murein DD-endopeptidase MepM/ murein hydrolase activator NlpD